jgi:hypothetical protein
MKIGGISWNMSPKKKRGIESRHVCKQCGRQYKMDWTKSNHEKLCIERFKNE